MSISLKVKAERKVFSDPKVLESMKLGAWGLADSHKRTKRHCEFVFGECFGEFANNQFGQQSHDIMKDVLEIVIPLGVDMSAWPKGTYEAVFAKICGPLKTMAACWYLSGVFAGAVAPHVTVDSETKS